MTNQQTALFILNALVLKAQGAPNVKLFNDEPTPVLRVGYERGDQLVYTTYTTPDWATMEKAAEDLGVAYNVFSTDSGLKASVTKDVDGTQVRLVFPVQHDGSEALVILNRILELYLRVHTWTLNPKVSLPGYGEMSDELFGSVN